MTNVVPFTLFTFDRLQFKAPPADIFEDLFGYTGQQRFVGFCYTSHALCIEDGQFNQVGHARPWSIWYRSLGVSVLRYYCFGYQGQPPEHLLILDRKSRTLYAAPVQAGQDALAKQVVRLQQTTGAAPSGEHRESDVDYLADSFFSSTSSRNNPVDEKKRIQRLEGWVASH
ncbi:hypothetical protein [Geomonas subterranea]|uniref:hypothetical protein n=1 Tax=Geomonas subterranea TaxID=2847989 RepID=UPI001CD1C3DB|nr:hypothetical protein [Geomonas fuzhouensis]